MNSLSVCQFWQRTESSCVVTTQRLNLKLWFISWCHNPLSFPLVNIYLLGQYIIILTSKEDTLFYLLQVLLLDTYSIRIGSWAVWDSWPHFLRVEFLDHRRAGFAAPSDPTTQLHGSQNEAAELGATLVSLSFPDSPLSSVGNRSVILSHNSRISSMDLGFPSCINVTGLGGKTQQMPRRRVVLGWETDGEWGNLNAFPPLSPWF